MILNIIYIGALIIIIRALHLINKKLNKMAVTDQNILDVVTAEQATLAELQTVSAQLATDIATAITDIQALPTGSPVQDSTLVSLQATQQALQTVADTLKGTSANLDTVVNPAPAEPATPDAQA